MSMIVANGGSRFQRAYLDFFEDELVRLKYDWKIVVLEYLFKGPEPLIYGGIGGRKHPMFRAWMALTDGQLDIRLSIWG
jgi:Questin oxidase-like